MACVLFCQSFPLGSIKMMCMMVQGMYMEVTVILILTVVHVIRNCHMCMTVTNLVTVILIWLTGKSPLMPFTLLQFTLICWKLKWMTVKWLLVAVIHIWNHHVTRFQMWMNVKWMTYTFSDVNDGNTNDEYVKHIRVGSRLYSLPSTKSFHRPVICFFLIDPFSIMKHAFVTLQGIRNFPFEKKNSQKMSRDHVMPK